MLKGFVIGSHGASSAFHGALELFLLCHDLIFSKISS